jgi:hypothetical protein
MWLEWDEGDWEWFGHVGVAVTNALGTERNIFGCLNTVVLCNNIGLGFSRCGSVVKWHISVRFILLLILTPKYVLSHHKQQTEKRQWNNNIKSMLCRDPIAIPRP